jgi:hypothetical protein
LNANAARTFLQKIHYVLAGSNVSTFLVEFNNDLCDVKFIFSLLDALYEGRQGCKIDIIQVANEMVRTFSHSCVSTGSPVVQALLGVMRRSVLQERQHIEVSNKK